MVALFLSISARPPSRTGRMLSRAAGLAAGPRRPVELENPSKALGRLEADNERCVDPVRTGTCRLSSGRGEKLNGEDASPGPRRPWQGPCRIAATAGSSVGGIGLRQED